MASPTIHSTTAPAAGGASTSNANTAVGDLVIVHTWERAGAGVPTHTLQSGFTELQSISHNDGSTDGRLSVAFKVATSSGAVSYQAYTTSTGSPAWWTGLTVIDAGTFSRGIVSAQVSATGTGAPNPPATIGLDFNRDYLALAISAWHLTASQTLTPAHSVYTLQTHVSGAATGDVAVASLAVAAGVITIDPGAYTDDQTPNGTCSVTLAVPSPPVTASAGGWTRREGLNAHRADAGTTPQIIFDEFVVDDLVVVYASADATGRAINSIADSFGNTWTQVIADTDWDTDDSARAFYSVISVAGIKPVVTVTLSGAPVYANLMGGVWVGVDTAAPLSDTSVGLDNTAAFNSGTITAATGDLVVGFCTSTSGNMEITASGWTELGPTDTTEKGTFGEKLNVASGDSAYSGTLTSDDWFALAAVFKVASSGQTIAVNQIVETDTAQAVAWAPKRRLVNQIVETDTAQVMKVNPIHRLVGQVSEVDTAQTITIRRSFPVGQVSEVDTAQAIAWAPKNRLVVRVFETDTAQAVAAQRAYPVGQVSEVDTAQTITPVKGGQLVAIGQVEEVDTAQVMAHGKVKVIGQVEEVDTAQAITVSQAKIIAAGQVSEIDTAQAISWAPKNRLVAQVEEVDAAFAITPVLGGGTIPGEVMVVIRGTAGAIEARVLIDDPTTTRVVIDSPNKIVVVQDPAAAPVEVII